MIYAFQISTPSKTYSSAPQPTWLRVEKGTLQELFIFFPPGNDGLHYLQIMYHESVAFPKTINYFHGNNLYLEFHNMDFKINNAPFVLKALTQNYDDLFSHELDIYLNIKRAGLIF